MKSRNPWDCLLPAPLKTKGGLTITTLADARALMISLGDDHINCRQYWRKAGELSIAAAETDGSVEAARDQIELALFLDGKLKLD